MPAPINPAVEIEVSIFAILQPVLPSPVGKETGKPGPDYRGKTKRERYNVVLDPIVAAKSKEAAEEDEISWSSWIEKLIQEALERRTGS